MPGRLSSAARHRPVSTDGGRLSTDDSRLTTDDSRQKPILLGESPQRAKGKDARIVVIAPGGPNRVASDQLDVDHLDLVGRHGGLVFEHARVVALARAPGARAAP